MAITKIWAVKDDLNRVLNYIKNPDKTKEEMSDGLKEVLSYTTQGYKTNEKEFITGINCEPRTALKQMMNTKLSYNKMDGRLAFHAVRSFKQVKLLRNNVMHWVFSLPNKCGAIDLKWLFLLIWIKTIYTIISW